MVNENPYQEVLKVFEDSEFVYQEGLRDLDVRVFNSKSVYKGCHHVFEHPTSPRTFWVFISLNDFSLGINFEAVAEKDYYPKEWDVRRSQLMLEALSSFSKVVVDQLVPVTRQVADSFEKLGNSVLKVFSKVINVEDINGK